MYWNYRVIKRTTSSETIFFITEVYYDDDDAIIGWIDEKTIIGDTIDELRQSLTWMLECLDKPILDRNILLEGFNNERKN